jgi:hypothetical protein
LKPRIQVFLCFGGEILAPGWKKKEVVSCTNGFFEKVTMFLEEKELKSPSLDHRFLLIGGFYF